MNRKRRSERKNKMDQIRSENDIEACEKYIAEHYGLLTSEEKSIIEHGGSSKGITVDGLRNASDISAAAVFISASASSQYLPVILSAGAVIEAPENAVIVNNFGTMVRNLKQIDESLTILLYAKSLESESPMILTNLGHSYLDKGETDKAEECYLKALELDPDFGSAHEGMAYVYIKRADGQKAINEIVEAAKRGYSPMLRAAYKAAKKAGGVIDIPPWDKLLNNDQKAPTAKVRKEPDTKR